MNVKIQQSKEDHTMRFNLRSTMPIAIIAALCIVLPCTGALSKAPAKQKNESIRLEKQVNGITKGKNPSGKDMEYYFLKATIKAATSATFTFRQGSCLLFDAEGKSNSDCWISVTGGSAGLSFTTTAPVSTNTFFTSASPGAPATRLNASKIDGPNGELAFSLPANGSVDLHFLWPVSREFKPGKIRLDGISEINLNKR
jgi:hypothetical protein